MILELIKRLRQGLQLMDKNPEHYAIHLPEDLWVQLTNRVKPSAHRFTPPHQWINGVLYVGGLYVLLNEDNEDILIKEVRG